MSTYTKYLDGSRSNAEALYKDLSRLFTSGVPLNQNSSSLQVVQRGAGANMSVDVSVGDAFLSRPAGDFSFWSWADSTGGVPNVSITTANPTNPRIDAIVAWVDVSLVTLVSNNSPGSLKFSAIAGTPAGSPSAPVDATIQSALGASVAWTRLGNVTVGAAVSSIVTANIADTRQPISLRSGQIVDVNNNELLKLISTASAVNEVSISNATTGSGPTISASGGDTNININITPKGTGRVVLGGAGAPDSASVITSETTSSTSYADLATTTDTVTATVGSSGKVWLSFQCTVYNGNSGALSMQSVAISGASTVVAGTYEIIDKQASLGEKTITFSQLIKGLTPGSTTFKLKYKVGAGTGTFSNRYISVDPK